MSDKSDPDRGTVSGLRSFAGLASSTVRAVKFEHLIAGLSGGVVSTLVLHPLDLIKIR